MSEGYVYLFSDFILSVSTESAPMVYKILQQCKDEAGINFV